MCKFGDLGDEVEDDEVGPAQPENWGNQQAAGALKEKSLIPL